MTDLRKAAEMALEALDAYSWEQVDAATKALRQALAQPEQECIYPECETGIGCDGPCGEKPVDTVKQEPAVYKCPRCATSMDVDLNAKPVDTINTSQERETAKRGHEPGLWVVQYKDRHEFVWGAKPVFRGGTVLGLKPLYTAPPKREWVDLDEEEQKECWDEGGSQWAIYQNIASKLKEKNGG